MSAANVLLRSWRAWLGPRLDARVQAALVRGERPKPIRGLANYEQAEVAAKLHRADQALAWEKSVGFGIAFGVPLAVTLAVLWSL